jgi:ribosomal protein S18 acetylase RimI-like enzyme
MSAYYDKLDNPVWYSLNEAHKQFEIQSDPIKFYHPDYCPFGGFVHFENMPEALLQYSTLVNNFFVVGEKPSLPMELKIKNDLVCLQMVVTNRIEIERNDAVTKLTPSHGTELYELVNFVQPGYFREKTNMLGDYFGIIKDGKLIAVTGERMKMNKSTEVSAVVTHPEHAGKGYAKQLVAHTVNNIFDQGKAPYLHVAETNIGAIRLYEKLGFRTRRKISFWNIVAKDLIIDQVKQF